MATTICCGENKWPLFWLTHWPNEYILVNTQQGWPLWQASITAHRQPSTQNIGVRSVGILGTLRTEPRESSIKLREYDRFKGFNGTVELQWLQWDVKEAQRLQGVQRGSKAFKGWREFLRLRIRRLAVRFEMFEADGVAEMQQLVRKCCKITTKWETQWRDRRGCCRNATSFYHGATACVTAAQQDTISCVKKD